MKLNGEDQCTQAKDALNLETHQTQLGFVVPFLSRLRPPFRSREAGTIQGSQVVLLPV
jgi:hypothetical protein